MSSGRPQVSRVRTEGERVASGVPLVTRTARGVRLRHPGPDVASASGGGDPTPPQGCAAAHLELSWASAEGS